MKTRIFKNKTLSGSKTVYKRRELLKGLAGIPIMAGFGGNPLRNWTFDKNDSNSSSSQFSYPGLTEINGTLPEGKIGNISFTRLMMGCNQIGGWAHARDLLYADTLFKAYNTEQKVIETFHLGEQAGIGATFMVNLYYPWFNRYLKEYGGKMKSICQTYISQQDFLGDIDQAIENGATALYIQGGEGDRFVRDGKIAKLAKAIEHIKTKGYPAGMGAHSLEVIKVCEKENIPVDFYVKTFHHDNYWSSHPRENRVEFSVVSDYSEDHNKFHDNMFDLFPDQTAGLMKSIKKPWIAFKVLAGGAIPTKDGFNYAFQKGADFICVGMFDFQVVNNVNTAIDVLAKLGNREREWYS
jgi:hypothetical protein